MLMFLKVFKKSSARNTQVSEIEAHSKLKISCTVFVIERKTIEYVDILKDLRREKLI